MLVLLATAPVFIRFKAQSIWFDEGWSAYAAAQPTLVAAWNADLTNPPLYYVLLNVAAHFFGTTEFALRFVSLLLGLPLIPLVFQLARRTAHSERAGRYAALLTACSAPLWWASQEARMYTLLALLITICALAWWILMIRPRRAAWIALWLSEVALLYAHNTGPDRGDLAQRRGADCDWRRVGANTPTSARGVAYLVDWSMCRWAALDSLFLSALRPDSGCQQRRDFRAADWPAAAGGNLGGAVGRALGAGDQGAACVYDHAGNVALIVVVVLRAMLRRAFWLICSCCFADR